MLRRASGLWQALSIRARLTIGYTATLSLLLFVYAGLVYTSVYEVFSSELDRRLDQEVEIAERSLFADAYGNLVWRPPAADTGDYQVRANMLWVDVYRSDGSLLHLQLGGYARGGNVEQLPFTPRPSGIFQARLSNGTYLRILQREVLVEGQRAVIRAAFAEDQIKRDLATLLLVLEIGLPLAIGAAGLAGYLLAGRALAPVARMTEEAQTITAERLDARLPVLNSGDELGRLAITFNELFSRLERSFEQLRRFTSDASHELRTPLAVIRSVGEVALREKRDDTAYRDSIGTMLEESDRLSQLVQNLLTLARADSGRIVLRREVFDFGRLAREAVDHLRVLAEEKAQTIDVTVTPLAVHADPAVLRQALVNVLDNAVKYSPPAGTIRVLVQQRGSDAVLEVADCGPGIAVEHLDRVFDRFYRVDAGRSRETGGFGLGLAIARWAVEVNGGRLEVDSRPGSGSVFRIALPAAVSHPSAAVAEGKFT